MSKEVIKLSLSSDATPVHELASSKEKSKSPISQIEN